ncbi:MAG: biotin--[acetyl-CoA-carboxylase] ligase [Oscillospiraceae bacterium]|nr:biotin--[acetyl-CoA-carboxylase] ligase [Oscillospiraceae bacterium]
MRQKKIKLDYEVIYKKSTESTNGDAKKYISKNNLLIIAEKQTAGKGRYGRNFYSENKNGIYFTVKLNRENIKLNIGDINFFPLIAALAVSRTVSDLCGIELIIKWPNDLLYKSDTGYKYKKVCGILTEASVKADESENCGVSYIIVGIGLNVNQNITDFPDDIKNTASSLKIISNQNKKYGRADIICETVNNFTQFLFMPRRLLLDEYRKKLLTGIDISFSQGGGIFKGKILDINETGNLIVKQDNGEETIIQSGEINFI